MGIAPVRRQGRYSLIAGFSKAIVTFLMHRDTKSVYNPFLMPQWYFIME